MWYIGARASRASASATSATVVSREHLSGRAGGVGEHAGGVLADRAVKQLDKLEHGDLGGRLCERVAPLDPPLRAEDPRAPKRREQLLEELRRDLPPPRELSDRHRPPIAMATQLDKRRQRIRALRSDRDHGAMIAGEPA